MALFYSLSIRMLMSELGYYNRESAAANSRRDHSSKGRSGTGRAPGRILPPNSPCCQRPGFPYAVWASQRAYQ